MTSRELWQAFKIGATFMGAVIGAGFASGQEIMQFFMVYGSKGLWGILLATILFCCLGTHVLLVTKKIRGNSYLDFLNYYLGPKYASVIDLLMSFVLLLGLGVMLAGSGALFKEQLGWPSWWGVLLTLVCVVTVLLGGIKRIQVVNLFLMPVLICFTLFMALFVWWSGTDLSMAGQNIPQPRVAPHWLLASILYVAYNMLLIVVILSSLGHSLSRRNYVAGGVIGGIGLGSVASMVYLAGMPFFPEVATYQVPMLYIASHVGSFFQNSYIFIIWVAITTTAIANAYGFARRIEVRTGWSHTWVGMVATGAMVPLASFEFIDLISHLYPLMGYLGLLIFLWMIGQQLRFFLKKMTLW